VGDAVPTTASIRRNRPTSPIPAGASVPRDIAARSVRADTGLVCRRERDRFDAWLADLAGDRP
jgi:hypothetical protein